MNFIEYGLRLRTRTGGFAFDRTAPSSNTNTAGFNITTGTWYHTTVILTKVTGGWTGSIAIDGTPLDTANTNPFDGTNPSGGVDLAIGTFSAQGTVDVQFDNVHATVH